MIFVTLMSAVVIALPVDPKEKFNETIQPALEVCFGNTWRIVLGSIVASWVGDFLNSYVLAKMKLATGGKLLWLRTISSTFIGQLADIAIFYPIAFAGVWEAETLLKVVAFNWIFKVFVEVVMTPFTYMACGWLKRKEGVDHYDKRTNFTPFSLKE